MNETRLQVDFNNNLGIATSVEGNLKKALAHYGESLSHYEKMGDSRGVAKTYHNLARTYADAECWSEAGVHYEKAYKLVKEVGDAHTQATIRLNQTELCIAIGDFNLAEALCHQAIKIYLRLEHQLGEAEAFKFSGIINTKKHDWLKAQFYFEHSILLTQKFENPLCEAEAHLEYGRMWKHKGDHKSARQEYEQALKLFTQIKAQKQTEKVKQEIAGFEHSHKNSPCAVAEVR